MRRREFPVLSDEDDPLVGRLALGLGEDAARVLAYLLLRRTDPAVEDGPADRLALRVGTGATRSALSDALTALDRRDLVTKTTIPADTGRPPTAWQARADIDTTIERVDTAHAEALFEQACSVATALGGPIDASTPDSGVEDPEAEPFTVGLNWFANALHAPLFAARADGSYQNRGLDVSIESFAGSDQALDALDAGAVDVAVAGAATVTNARATASPVVPLAPLYQRTMTVLYTTREAFGGRLDGVESLRGRRVGMPVGAETGLLGRLYLSQSGVLDEVTVVDLTGEEGDALAAGRVDAVSGSVGDVRALEAAGHTVDVLSVDEHFPVYGPTLVTSEALVHDRPDALVAFLAGTVAGWRTAWFDPQTAIDAVDFSDTASRDVPAQAALALEDAVERFGTSSAVSDHGWGWHDITGWERLSTALGQVGLLDEGLAGGDAGE